MDQPQWANKILNRYLNGSAQWANTNVNHDLQAIMHEPPRCHCIPRSAIKCNPIYINSVKYLISQGYFLANQITKRPLFSQRFKYLALSIFARDVLSWFGLLAKLNTTRNIVCVVAVSWVIYVVRGKLNDPIVDRCHLIFLNLVSSYGLVLH